MGKPIDLDFTGAPPAQGGTGSDRIPAGQYLLAVKETRTQATSSGNNMLVLVFRVLKGQEQNKQIVERFTLDGDSKFPLQRLHAMLLAFDLKVPAKFTLDFDRLIGKPILADVSDNEIPANGQYPARTVSQIRSFFSVAASAAKAPAAAPATPAPAPKAAAQAPAPAPAAEPEADDSGMSSELEVTASDVEALDSIFD